ncbi:hypothetical protein [Pseudoduganella chitinolytica]|uniref:Uncharacterized protein n=1 Tax=Pseudoduganella chitinolytica TaxID=34070 RepID=A0ABY8BIV5_9BURK|nr:hypothetical protein [Pseudoduganella chitinolytica]WEF34888.1 hypothetical protein PX653_09050 [Pseudoduganella chitinolytica]
MEDKRVAPATPAEKIVHHVVNVWRPADKEAVADKGNQEKRSAQYLALRDLRKLADEAGRK